MRYLCLVHFEQTVVTTLSPEAGRELDRASIGYDRELKDQGHFIASDALQAPDTAVLVKVRNGEISATDGPFSETKEQLGGFILIEARDMNEAIRLAAGIPLAKMGTIEVRPIYTIPDPNRP
jgi:hypothetical protein